jgi:ubiquinone/menaquinone biosynthesis C-methylase UbiE
MPDVYAAVKELDTAMQARLVDVLETRGADPQQQTMRRAFLADIPFPPRARVLEVGCGTGVLTRVLARWTNVGDVVGIDPAPAFLRKARELAADLPNVSFQEADGRELSFDDATFDAVLFDSTLSHVPSPELALAESYRVLRPGGVIAAFDGDYSTTTVALSPQDPLQACSEATMAHSVTDRWLMRRLPEIVAAVGFEVMGSRSHGFIETTPGGYMLTVIDRGADILTAAGQIGESLATALKNEARRRVEAGAFFGHVAYVSVIARKPA